MGLGELALAGLGLVLVGSYSTKTGAGEGLGTLGAGVTSLIAAPGTGVGLGLQETAKGIFDIGEAIGGIGAGFGKWFEWINPFDNDLVPPAGGSPSEMLVGGGGNVPIPMPRVTVEGPEAPTHEPRIPLGSLFPGVYSVTGPGPGTTWTYQDAPTYWKTEAAAMKNYARAMDQGINNV